MENKIVKRYTPSWYSPRIFLPERLMGRDDLMVVTLIFHGRGKPS